MRFCLSLTFLVCSISVGLEAPVSVMAAAFDDDRKKTATGSLAGFERA